jgi:UTP--glucose-1-phosphate uridylyltransferase
MFSIFRNQPAGAGGEIQLIDAIDSRAENEAVVAVKFNGGRFDCGSANGYLNAITLVAGR